MSNPVFDTLEYCEALEKAGVPEKQAKAQAGALSNAMQSNLTTKEDLTELNHKIEMVEKTLTIRLSGMITIATGLIVSVTIGTMAYFSG